jgi:hypothetical protein
MTVVVGQPEVCWQQLQIPWKSCNQRALPFPIASGGQAFPVVGARTLQFRLEQQRGATGGDSSLVQRRKIAAFFVGHTLWYSLPASRLNCGEFFKVCTQRFATCRCTFLEPLFGLVKNLEKQRICRPISLEHIYLNTITQFICNKLDKSGFLPKIVDKT